MLYESNLLTYERVSSSYERDLLYLRQKLSGSVRMLYESNLRASESNLQASERGSSSYEREHFLHKIDYIQKEPPTVETKGGSLLLG